MYCNVMDVKKFILVLLGWICKHWQQSAYDCYECAYDCYEFQTLYLFILCHADTRPQVFKWPEIEEN